MLAQIVQGNIRILAGFWLASILLVGFLIPLRIQTLTIPAIDIAVIIIGEDCPLLPVTQPVIPDSLLNLRDRDRPILTGSKELCNFLIALILRGNFLSLGLGTLSTSKNTAPSSELCLLLHGITAFHRLINSGLYTALSQSLYHLHDTPTCPHHLCGD